VETVNLPKGLYAQQVLRTPATENLSIYGVPVEGVGMCQVAWLEVKRKRMNPIAEFECPFSSSNIFKVAPNEDRLIVGWGEKLWLLDARTGQIIRDFPTMYNMEWSSIHWIPAKPSALLMGSLSFKSSEILNVLLEPTTNTSINMMPSQEGRIVVIQ
jgi:hypothetical protein